MQKICLVIPCYNEEIRLQKNLIIDFLKNESDIVFCFVNDGSTDHTLEVLNEIKKINQNKTIIISNKKNRGKAESVRDGILHALEMNEFAFIGFWDADLSTPLAELKTLMKPFESNNDLLFSIGSRWKRMGSSIDRKISRHYFGRVFATFASIILKLPVYDTQCGAKVMRSEIINILFKEKFVSKWFFDVELIARLRNYVGMQKIYKTCYEVPLNSWKDIGASKLRFSDLLTVPIDLLKIHFRYN